MKMKLFICIALVIAFISGCALIEGENNVYTHNYMYLYSAEKDITYTGAWFSFPGAGGTTEIQEDEKISVNGNELKWGFESETWDNYDDWGNDFTGKIEDVEFQFQQLHGDDLTMKFSYTNMPVAEIPALPETIDNSPLEIEWIGEPLKDEEVLRAEIYDGYHYNDVVLSFEEGATSITIPSSILNEAYSGDIISITLIRTIDDYFNTDHEGSITYKYISQTATTEME